MGLLRTVAAFAGLRTPAEATDTPAFSLRSLLESAEHSGSAPTILQTQKSVGAALLIQRETLAAEAKHLRNLSRCKEASLAETDLRLVTTAILRRGPDAT